MFVYQLSDKKEDQLFLEFKPVTCRITLKSNQSLQEDEHLVIKLSNGKSYKGKVLKVTLIPLYNHQFGEMDVVRV